MNSILTSIKKLLGITKEYEDFDEEIIIHINSAFSVLTQLGIGPNDGFAITDSTAEWSAFLSNGHRLEFVKNYVYLKVKLGFDPPTNSAAIDAINRQISELEWRIIVANETI